MNAPQPLASLMGPKRRDRSHLSCRLLLACLLLAFAQAANADTVLEVQSASPVVIDKRDFNETAYVPPFTLFVFDAEPEVDGIRLVEVQFFTLPFVPGAAGESFSFSFNAPPDRLSGVGDDATSFALAWDTATGHMLSEIIPVRLHFSNAGGRASADIELILTTDHSLLPEACSANLLEFDPLGEPLTGDELTLAGAGCVVNSGPTLANFGLLLELDLKLVEGVELGLCGDQIDNDEDGLTDLNDPGCTDLFDYSEKSPDLICDDGLDNDGDGKIDFPADPDCGSPSTPVEAAVCGDGILSPGEDCDDGNTFGGDCCSPSCQFDPSGTSCNDGSVCSQTDTCDGSGTCQGASLLSCSDGSFCNGEEICDPLTGCRAGSPPQLSDGISCTIDTCNEQTDTVDHAPDHELCEDGLFCTGDRFCDASLGCQSSPPELGDGVHCTVDFCNEFLDQISHTPNDAICNDGSICNGVETCDATLDCQPGEPISLDDGIACTVDSCTAQGIKHTPNNSLCDDGLYCTGIELCDAQLGCLAGTPPNESEDDVECTITVCDEVTKTNYQQTSDALCDDGLFCNGAERCFPNGCLPGVPLPINDFLSCTEDSCDEETDTISHTPMDALCDDGAFCNGTELCDATLGCQAGQAPPVDDGIECTSDFCNEAEDEITHLPFNFSCDDGVFCNGAEVCQVGVGCTDTPLAGLDDSVACTEDSCDEASRSILHAPIDSLCDDGAFCNGSESCSATLGCQVGVAPFTGDGVSCTQDSCDEATDQIVHQPDSSLCDDGAFCNGAEVCDVSLDCQAGVAPTVDDGISCTQDSCDEAGDRVVNLANPALCSDGNFCNGDEICDTSLGCQAGIAPSTDDGVSCTEDSCNETTDEIVHLPNSGLCNDGAFCNGVESCDPVLGCQAGSAPDLEDGVACTVDSCDEASDQIVHQASAALCDDGSFCNGAETCDITQGCQTGTAPALDDGVACTDDSCNETIDQVVHQPNPGLCDDGSFCNGAEICDAVAGCLGGVAPTVDDGVACTSDSCDESLDQLVHVPNSALCDDGQFCNGVESCDPTLGCLDGMAPTGSDDVACTNDECDEATDQFVFDPSDALCDDGNPCTADRCDAVLGCASDAIPGCGLPDLQIAEVSGASEAVVGQRVNASAAVLQMSDTAPAIGPVNVAFFLSTDEVISSEDMMLGDCVVPELVGTSQDSCQGNGLEIPAQLVSLQAGEEKLFYWGACADPSGVIDEELEDNNCASGSSILVPEPAAWALQLAGLAGLLALRRRSRTRLTS